MKALRHRAPAFALAILLNMLLITALLMLGQRTIARPADERSIATFDVAQESLSKTEPARVTPPVLKPPQPIVIPTPFPTIPRPLSDEVITLLAVQDRMAATGIACDLTAPLQTALQSSGEVQVALREIPSTQRSVANAIMLWDGAWTATEDRAAASALQMVREIVVQTIVAAGPECRFQAQSGPRLVYLSSDAVTTSLAIGSGQWRWQDVFDTAQVADGDPTLSAITDRSGTTVPTK